MRHERPGTVALDTDTISYLIASPISLPYLPPSIAFPYLFVCAAPRDLYAAIATTCQPSNPSLCKDFSHSIFSVEFCGSILNLSKTIDLSLSLRMSFILSN